MNILLLPGNKDSTGKLSCSTASLNTAYDNIYLIEMKTPGILLLIGGLLDLIYGLLFVATGSLMAGFGGAGDVVGAFVGVVGGLFVIFGILLILAGLWHGKKPAWAWIGLIVSLLSLLVPFGGFYIGPFLGAIGAALAMKKGK